jgi:hypothetical protein
MLKSKPKDLTIELSFSSLTIILLKEFYTKEVVLTLHNKMGEWRGNTSTY